MADLVRDRTGPLGPVHIEVLTGVMAGRTHAEIGASLVPPLSKAHVSLIMSAAVARMGCRKSTEAVYRYSTHLAYLDAAQLLEESQVELNYPADPLDERANELLLGLAQILRNRAATLIPS